MLPLTIATRLEPTPRRHRCPCDGPHYSGLRSMKTASLPTTEEYKAVEFENLKRKIHGKLVDKLDLSRVGELAGDVLRREIRLVVEHLCDTEETFLNRQERERLIE